MLRTRRQFLMNTLAMGSLTNLGFVLKCSDKTEHPNILWITSEDNSPFFGCYGDTFATTPNFDRFAQQGILFKNAFATAPVCAPARNTIITGVYPPSMGTQHMRSRYPIPAFIKKYPKYLKEMDYYCTNNSKTDYNLLGDDKADWDECSKEAHYKNRRPGQPFFAVFNVGISHESSIHTSVPWDTLRHNPLKVPLPPYHPDTRDIRHDWAQYYDKIEDLDTQFADILSELEENDLEKNTIVFYYADHGGVLARSKRFLYDSGLHVPMILRFPEKYQHLAPGRPGTTTDQIVTFIDLPKTVLSLAGIKPPEYMQGVTFLGKYKEPERQYAHSFRGRMDERYDFSRTIRDKKFRYVRHFNPFRKYGQHLEYLWKAPATRSWEAEYMSGRCNEVQSRFWQAKPAEELFDSINDPWEVNNLVANPEYSNVLERMQKDLRMWMLEIRDAGFIPEGKLVDISKSATIYEYVHSDEYELERIIETAEMATDYNPQHMPELNKRLGDKDFCVRFWAATGALVLGPKAASLIDNLKKCLNDQDGDLVAVAAEALVHLGDEKEGVEKLIGLLESNNDKVVLRALNALTEIGNKARPALEKVKTLANSQDNYILRAANHLIKILN